MALDVQVGVIRRKMREEDCEFSFWRHSGNNKWFSPTINSAQFEESKKEEKKKERQHKDGAFSAAVMVLLGNVDVENEERKRQKRRERFFRLALLHETVTNQVKLLK